VSQDAHTSRYERNCIRQVASTLGHTGRFIRETAEMALFLNEEGLVEELDTISRELDRIVDDWKRAHAIP
jgi:hypothetical protein